MKVSQDITVDSQNPSADENKSKRKVSPFLIVQMKTRFIDFNSLILIIDFNVISKWKSDESPYSPDTLDASLDESLR